MRVPKVTLENEAAVTEHYSKVKQNKPLMSFIFSACAQLFNVETHYESNAEDRISRALQSGRQLLIAHNHQKFIDPLILASMVKREKALNEISKRGVAVPGRSKLFNNFGYGWIVRHSGVAIPVYLEKDFVNKEDPSEVQEATKARIKEANKSQIAIVKARMNRGEHGAIYPEGSRNRANDEHFTVREEERDPTKLVSPLHQGIGQIACGLDNPRNVSIVPIATIYKSDQTSTDHHISFVGMPFAVSETPEKVVSDTERHLQIALNRAAAIAGLKPAA